LSLVLFSVGFPPEQRGLFSFSTFLAELNVVSLPPLSPFCCLIPLFHHVQGRLFKPYVPPCAEADGCFPSHLPFRLKFSFCNDSTPRRGGVLLFFLCSILLGVLRWPFFSLGFWVVGPLPYRWPPPFFPLDVRDSSLATRHLPPPADSSPHYSFLHPPPFFSGYFNLLLWRSLPRRANFFFRLLSPACFFFFPYLLLPLMFRSSTLFPKEFLSPVDILMPFFFCFPPQGPFPPWDFFSSKEFLPPSDDL